MELLPAFEFSWNASCIFQRMPAAKTKKRLFAFDTKFIYAMQVGLAWLRMQKENGEQNGTTKKEYKCTRTVNTSLWLRAWCNFISQTSRHLLLIRARSRCTRNIFKIYTKWYRLCLSIADCKTSSYTGELLFVIIINYSWKVLFFTRIEGGLQCFILCRYYSLVFIIILVMVLFLVQTNKFSFWFVLTGNFVDHLRNAPPNN